MAFDESFERIFRKLLPSPLVIAFLLTLLTLAIALIWGEHPAGQSPLGHSLHSWSEGLWNGPMLVFMVQMMLILVLGHSLALAPPVHRLIYRLVSLSDNPATATALTCLFTMLVAFFNWGLGLIFGAILARKTAENLQAKGIHFNYGLLGAAGYSGLMVWHGGISGSAPIKVVEAGHLKSMVSAHLPQRYLEAIPEQLSFEHTIFSSMNISSTVLLLLLIPALTYWWARRAPRKEARLSTSKASRENPPRALGAEKLERSNYLGRGLGLGILLVAAMLISQAKGLGFINPNFINLSLLSLGLLLHGSLRRFSAAVDQAIGGAAGILIQFPLYFGILGIMRHTELVTNISSFFSSHATAGSFPVFTFFSAGLINLFVPSGGGQWVIQGPVLIQASQDLGIPLGKAIMAMAYGDQVTNMLQPFWALPLLAITGLKARAIIPYTLAYLVLGSLVFIAVLLLF